MCVRRAFSCSFPRTRSPRSVGAGYHPGQRHRIAVRGVERVAERFVYAVLPGRYTLPALLAVSHRVILEVADVLTV